MADTSSSEDQILRLYAGGNWREILHRFDRNKFLPWIWPEEKNLEFIGCHVQKQNSNSIVSIGCGSGLLEWLLTMATGIEVLGIEINGICWMAKHSTGTFIPLTLVNDSDSGRFDVDTTRSVLLFCYFNNLSAFLWYLNNFKGNCFIVIGPGEGRGAYSVPEPFRLPEIVAGDWTLFDHQEIRSSKDFIVVYVRKK